jgi:hypothetical protein
MPNSRTARANDRSQLVSLKFMMPRWVSGPSEQLLRVGGADGTSVSRLFRLALFKTGHQIYAVFLALRARELRALAAATKEKPRATAGLSW